MPTPIDTIAAKTAGLMEAMKAGRAGLVGVFRTLSEQHGEVGALFERVKKHPAKREDLWPKIRVELLAHEKAELREVYPVIRTSGGADLAARHEREATELEQTIMALDSTDIKSAAWMPLFEQLAASVVSHAHEEEDDIFPQAQKLVGHDIAKDLDKAFTALYKDLKKTLAA